MDFFFKHELKFEKKFKVDFFCLHTQNKQKQKTKKKIRWLSIQILFCRKNVSLWVKHLLRLEEEHLNGDIRLNRDRGDLLDDLRRRVQVDDALVDAHLVAVPGVGTVTARRLAHGQAEALGRHANRTLDLELLVASRLDQVSAH